MITFVEAEILVEEKITGFRKGTTDVPNYTHSLHVRNILKKYGFNDTVQMAGLLHDIIEDGGMTLKELRDLGYPEKVLTLVDLATHNNETKDSFQRRKDMIKRLEEADNKDARAVKLADICDNVTQCHLMPNLEKKKRFLYEKCPYFVKQGNKYFGGTEFYQEFLNRYLKQMFRLLEWDDDKKFLPEMDDDEMIYWCDEGIYYKFPNKITESNKHKVESFDAHNEKYADFYGDSADEIANYCFESNYSFGHEISESSYNSARDELENKFRKHAEEIRYTYDSDFFVKWSYEKTYEFYDRLSGRLLDMSDVSSERKSEIVAHSYFYGVTTDEETFYKKIKESQELYDKEHGL